MELVTKEVPRVIADLAESALRARGLLVRPIPFFERLDRFRVREEELKQRCERYLDKFDRTAAERILRSYAFAGELSRDVLRNFCPSLPQEGESAQRTLWGAAVAIDQLLDEDGLDPASLAPLRDWVAGQTWDPGAADNRRLHASDRRLSALATMLAAILTSCRRRAGDPSSYPAFQTGLLRMLDAELASPGVTLDRPPVPRVRRIVRDKSILLAWVGFQACAIGGRFDAAAERDHQEICHAVGEVLWIMDDLMDLQEDLDRGVWNRALWRLYDRAGELRFRGFTRSKARLAEAIIDQRIVPREIDEISKRLAFLETHPRISDPAGLRAMMAFWLTAWTGIYW